MEKKYVRVVSTDSVPSDNRPVVESTIVWSGQHKSIDEAVASLRRWARERNYDAITGLRIMQTQQIYNAGGHDINSFPGLIILFIVYGTAVRYASDE